MSYNGHTSYNAWNISLWINNDESLYNMARDYISMAANKEIAAQAMTNVLSEMGTAYTPDGVPYTKTNIRKAMVGM